MKTSIAFRLAAIGGLLALLALSGCTTTQPWERGTLADSTMPWPPSRSHAEARFQGAELPRSQVIQGRPTRRRISAGVAPWARSSRKPVASVDFDSFRSELSRMRR